jgi:hypothetical protein
MQQQIRGWRFAAERTGKCRGLRGSAETMSEAVTTACGALGRMVARARDTRRRRRAPAVTRPMRALRSMSAERTPARRPARSMPAMTYLPDLGDMPTMADLRAMQAVQAMRAMRSLPMTEVITVRRLAGGMGVLVAGMGVAGWIVTRSRSAMGDGREHETKNRWMMVTVNCSPQRLASRADLPEPITRLGDAVDIKICPAPGDRGTELGVRLRELPRTRMAGMLMRRTGEDPRRMVERALRDAKAIIEAGEVVRPDRPASAQAGKLLEFAGRRGGRS